jgi:peroxiredoxin
VLAIRVVSLAAMFLGAAGAPALAAPHAGDVAPAFTLPRTTGGNLTLSSLHGKAIYLNFFASWCSPCNAEAPSVADLAKKYAPRGLKVVGVNEQEDKSKAAAFAQKYKWPFAVAVDDGEMGKAYGVIALPVHIFIDKHGKISTYRLGEMEPDEIADAIKKII